MAVHGSVGASVNAVGPSYDQSTTRLNHVRAVTRPRQRPRRRESARQGRGPAIEMRLAAGRQLPVDLCPVRCSPRALFFPADFFSPLWFHYSGSRTRIYAAWQRKGRRVPEEEDRVVVQNFVVTVSAGQVRFPFGDFDFRNTT